MTKAQDGSSARHKGNRLRRLLILTLLLGAGIVYLDKEGFDWKQKLAALQEWFSDSSPVPQADVPAQSPGLPPSFDIAFADETGKLVAAGRAEEGWIVRLASGSQTLGEAKADENGEWVLIPEQPLAPGEHILSLLATDPLSRRSISGRRSITLSIAHRPENVASANAGQPKVPKVAGTNSAGTEMAATEVSPGAGKKDCTVAVVKQGDTLWQMANHCYGDGAKYSKIFESNRPQVRDPNLIYPAQQLVLPH